VEKADGTPVILREYLEQVWAAIAKEALSLVFREADTSGLEPDARLTAMWLWTLSTGLSESNGNAQAEEDGQDTEDEGDEDSAAGSTKSGALSLEFDAARKIAQGLGAHLEDLRSVVEIKGKTARLLHVSERAKHLFGKDNGKVAAAPRKPRRAKTGFLPGMSDAQTDADSSDSDTFGDIGSLAPAATVLDRVHQAMILFGSGRAEALKRFLVEEGAGSDHRFWKLAQSLSALYPMGTEEKRWVDGVLARKKGLGF
jgi:hypothetical protein